VEALVEILMRDRSFYRHSHGGITLSGGECTLYADYLEVLLRELKARRLHLALETCGHFDFDIFRQKILPYVDLIYYDVKIADPAAHRQYTGKTNERIVDNLRRLIEERGAIVRPRIPLVPEITATRRNISDIVRLLDGIGAENVTLLPYNPMGLEMWTALGKSKPGLSERVMTPEEERNVRSMFQAILKERRDGADRHSGGIRGQHVLPRPG
jgi:pyruvate formate lyase activating enzyme